MEIKENHELREIAGSARKNILANKATAVIKFAFGVFARDPVLASEGGHDLGDANVHGDHEKEANAETPEEARRFAIRSAKKLGAFSLIGAGVEAVIENKWNFAPNHIASFVVASLSLALNVALYRDAAKHTHDRSHSLRSHTYWDQYVSGVTLINAASLLAGQSVNPLLPIAAHVALSFAPVIEIYRHKPTEGTLTPQTEEGDPSDDKAE